MTFLLIFLLIIVVCCFLLLRYYKISLIFIFIILLLFITIGCGYVAKFLASILEAPYNKLAVPLWQNNNAIIVLGGGLSKNVKVIQPAGLAYPRIHEGARLYFLCKNLHNNCTILISGGDPQGYGKSEAVAYKKSLQDLGINSGNIIVEPQSLNTYENGKLTNNILKLKGFDNLILVTSAIHMKRSILIFNHFGMHVTAAVANYALPKISKMPLASNFMITDLILHEYLGIAQFYMYKYFGW